MAARAARFLALVPCAGIGARAGLGLPKQYASVRGEAMVAHTLRALLAVPRLEAVLVVLAPDDGVFEARVPGFAGDRGWVARVGADHRAGTVRNGLAALAARGADAHDWVLVHDAARCLIRPALVDRLIDDCRDDAVGGLLAMPLADTLKREDGGRACATLARGDKWLAQTPQMFRLGPLQRALSGHADVTDEASAIEAMGLRPRLVRGEAFNLKVTWPGDFALAEALCAAT